jgi:hypothetical protein
MSSNIDAVDKIILSKQHDVVAWLVPALNKLAQRDDLLTVGDAERLIQAAGLKFLMQLWHVRETYVTAAPAATRDGNTSWDCLSSTCNDFYCVSHSMHMHKPSLTDTVTWPCGTCTTYGCGSHWHDRRFDKFDQASTRAQYDFTSQIRKVYNISS